MNPISMLGLVTPRRISRFNAPLFDTLRTHLSTAQLIVVSETFRGLSIIKRHRLVQDLFSTELALGREGGIHALSITAKSPEEELKVEASPRCLGGSKADR